MADTDEVVSGSETVAPGDSKTETTSATAPSPDNSNADLQAQLEKAKMEAAMLRNQKDKLEKAQADAAKKELEEKEEFRTLYEKEKAEREAIQNERAEAEKKTQLEADAKEVFSKFNSNVVDVAKSAGLSLEDTTEAAKTALTERLQAIADKVKSPGVSGNNPAPAAEGSNLNSAEVLRSISYGNKDAKREFIRQSPSIQAVKQELQKQAGVNFTQQ